MQIRGFASEDYSALAAIHNGQNIVWTERPHIREA